ncbi:MAG: response regulator, partial [Cyanobacteria bacterium J06614_10]
AAAGTVTEGTGLGLSISRRFVQLMGGNMRLTSRTQAPSGTLVKFDITATVAAVPERKTPPAIRQQVVKLAPGQPRYRLLVVDDKADNRKLMLDILSPVGFEIEEAENGLKAIKLCETWQPDLIWMDLRMPVLDGWEATKKIRAAQLNRPSDQSRIKIVALSASSLPHEQTAAREAGCDAFISKPFHNTKIFDTLSQLLDVRFIYGDTVAADALQQTVPALRAGARAVSKTDANPRLSSQAASSLAALEANWQSLAERSPALVAKLESAVERLQWAESLALIEEVRSQDPPLADHLYQAIHKFQYSAILEEIRAVKQ